MLVYTEPGKIELLPAWPEEYADGKLTGIRLYGGHLLNLEWKNGKLIKANIQAGKNETLQIKYKRQIRKLQLTEGKNFDITF